MSQLYRVPVSYRGHDYLVLNTGVYMDGKVYCHLSQVDNPPRQIGVFLPVEDVFDLDNPELLKKLAACKGRYSDAVSIPWSLLYQEDYSQEEVLTTIRQGIDVGIFRYRYSHAEPWSGQPLYLNTRPERQEYVA